HLHHDTVNLIIKVVALRFHRTTELDYVIDRFAELSIFINAKAGLLCPVQRFPMRRKRFALPGKHVVSEHLQAPSRGDRRIELANRSRRCVTRISESRLTSFFTFRVDAFEDATS